MNQLQTEMMTNPRMVVYTDPRTGIQQLMASCVTLAELEKRFWAHLYVNHYEFILELEQAQIFETYMKEVMRSVTSLLEKLLSEGNPDYVVEELCLNMLLEEVRPAHFPYFLQVFSEQLAEIYQIWHKKGILKVQIINFTRFLRGRCRLDGLFENPNKQEIYQTITNQLRSFFYTQKHLLAETALVWDEH